MVYHEAWKMDAALRISRNETTYDEFGPEEVMDIDEYAQKALDAYRNESKGDN